MTPQANSAWQRKVRLKLRQGYGVEDIAVQTGVHADYVRREVDILRKQGVLMEVLRVDNRE